MSKPKPQLDNPNGFSQRLRELRRQKNLTQLELAKLSEVSQVHIGRLEKASSQPTADIIKRLADGLGVSSGYLIEGQSEKAVLTNLEDAELASQFQQISKLPQEEKTILKSLVDAFLFRRQVQSLSHKT